jgi:hypothetical protein
MAHRMLAGIAQGIEIDPKLVWPPTDFLKANSVSAWSCPCGFPAIAEPLASTVATSAALSLAASPAAADTWPGSARYPPRVRASSAPASLPSAKSSLLARLKA